ncbi:hypothetical protein Bca101_031861 [Brassica carinata]
MMASDPKLKAEMDLQEKLLLLPTQRSVHIANLRSLSLYQCSILLTVSFLGKEEGGKEHGQRPATAEGESKSRKKPQIQGRGRGIGIMNNKGRGGWTGAGFDVDVRT